MILTPLQDTKSKIREVVNHFTFKVMSLTNWLAYVNKL